MILMKDDFRVALVTGHIPVKEIAGSITKELIQEKLKIFNRSLKQDFAIGAPRIAVLSLNPHAGDGGLLGTEEQEIIIPAINEMAAKGMLCYGPYPADGFMGSDNFTHFDGILAMYHDQGWHRSRHWLWTRRELYCRLAGDTHFACSWNGLRYRRERNCL